MIRVCGIVGSVPEHRTEDPGSKPGPDKNFPLKLTTQTILIKVGRQRTE